MDIYLNTLLNCLSLTVKLLDISQEESEYLRKNITTKYIQNYLSRLYELLPENKKLQLQQYTSMDSSNTITHVYGAFDVHIARETRNKIAIEELEIIVQQVMDITRNTLEKEAINAYVSQIKQMYHAANLPVVW